MLIRITEFSEQVEQISVCGRTFLEISHVCKPATDIIGLVGRAPYCKSDG